MPKKQIVLSTKKLDAKQTLFLEKAGFLVVSTDFIQTKPIEFSIKTLPTLLLFTSQNAIKSVLLSEYFSHLQKIPAICVGTKTKEALENQGIKVLYHTDYAEELATIVIEQFSKEKIAFFAGNIRRNTLPNAMKSHKISFLEYTVYQTIAHVQTIDFIPDYILFYSPSGVQSYLKKNSLYQSKIICIGTTTAQALEGVKNKIYISDKPTIESVLEKCKQKI